MENSTEQKTAKRQRKTYCKSEDVLEFICQYYNKYGISPTYRDICRGLGFKSSATAYYHIQLLKEAGKITILGKGASRAFGLPNTTAKENAVLMEENIRLRRLNNELTAELDACKKQLANAQKRKSSTNPDFRR